MNLPEAYSEATNKSNANKRSTLMKNLTVVFLMSIILSGCIVTASSGTRTEYEDKMKIIEKDYRDKKITEDQYIQLKDQASQQGKTAGQQDSSMGSGQSYP